MHNLHNLSDLGKFKIYNTVNISKGSKILTCVNIRPDVGAGAKVNDVNLFSRKLN